MVFLLTIITAYYYSLGHGDETSKRKSVLEEENLNDLQTQTVKKNSRRERNIQLITPEILYPSNVVSKPSGVVSDQKDTSDKINSSWTSGVSDSGNYRSSHTAVIYNNKMYVFGGHTVQTGFLNTLRIFDFATNSWSAGATDDIGGGRGGHTAVVYNDKMYIYGGSPANNSMRIYDFKTDTWTSGPSNINGDPNGQSGHTAVVYKNKMYIYGMGGTSVNVLKFQAFDFEKNRWVLGTQPPSSFGMRVMHSSVVYQNKIYIYGGNPVDGKSDWTNTLYIYDIDRDAWFLGPADTGSNGRNSHTSVVFGHKMYIFGGITGDGGYLTNSMRIFDFDANQWSNGKPDVYKEMRHRHSSVIFGEKMYVFGGETSYFDRLFSDKMRIYDFNEN